MSEAKPCQLDSTGHCDEHDSEASFCDKACPAPPAPSEAVREDGGCEFDCDPSGPNLDIHAPRCPIALEAEVRRLSHPSEAIAAILAFAAGQAEQEGESSGSASIVEYIEDNYPASRRLSQPSEAVRAQLKAMAWAFHNDRPKTHPHAFSVCDNAVCVENKIALDSESSRLSAPKSEGPWAIGGCCPDDGRKQYRHAKGLCANFVAPKREEACGPCSGFKKCGDPACAPAPGLEEMPVPMVLYCPNGHQHIDEGEWATKPHKAHQCQHVWSWRCPSCGNPFGAKATGCDHKVHEDQSLAERCGQEWRPASFPTVGVAALPDAEKR